MASSEESFEKTVFINCPFDSQYQSLLRPLLFTVVYLGFNPKIASERSDSGELRLNKICQFIRESKYSIHDLSRLQSAQEGEYYRMNMPFELGIEYGSRLFSGDHLRDKKCLILEKQRFEYMKAFSDLAGIDIKDHEEDPAKLVRQVRNWFVETVGLRGVPGPTAIWYSFTDFMLDFYDKRKSEGFSDEDLDWMPVAEFTDFIREWVQESATEKIYWAK